MHISIYIYNIVLAVQNKREFCRTLEYIIGTNPCQFQNGPDDGVRPTDCDYQRRQAEKYLREFQQSSSCHEDTHRSTWFRCRVYDKFALAVYTTPTAKSKHQQECQRDRLLWHLGSKGVVVNGTKYNDNRAFGG